MAKFFKNAFKLIVYFLIFYLPVFLFREELSWDYESLGRIICWLMIAWVCLVGFLVFVWEYGE